METKHKNKLQELFKVRVHVQDAYFQADTFSSTAEISFKRTWCLTNSIYQLFPGGVVCQVSLNGQNKNLENWGRVTSQASRRIGIGAHRPVHLLWYVGGMRWSRTRELKRAEAPSRINHIRISDVSTSKVGRSLSRSVHIFRH